MNRGKRKSPRSSPKILNKINVKIKNTSEEKEKKNVDKENLTQPNEEAKEEPIPRQWFNQSQIITNINLSSISNIFNKPLSTSLDNIKPQENPEEAKKKQAPKKRKINHPKLRYQEAHSSEESDTESEKERQRLKREKEKAKQIEREKEREKERERQKQLMIEKKINDAEKKVLRMLQRQENYQLMKSFEQISSSLQVYYTELRNILMDFDIAGSKMVLKEEFFEQIQKYIYKNKKLQEDIQIVLSILSYKTNGFCFYEDFFEFLKNSKKNKVLLEAIILEAETSFNAYAVEFYNFVNDNKINYKSLADRDISFDRFIKICKSINYILSYKEYVCLFDIISQKKQYIKVGIFRHFLGKKLLTEEQFIENGKLENKHVIDNWWKRRIDYQRKLEKKEDLVTSYLDKVVIQINANLKKLDIIDFDDYFDDCCTSITEEGNIPQKIFFQKLSRIGLYSTITFNTYLNMFMINISREFKLTEFLSVYFSYYPKTYEGKRILFKNSRRVFFSSSVKSLVKVSKLLKEYIKGVQKKEVPDIKKFLRSLDEDERGYILVSDVEEMMSTKLEPSEISKDEAQTFLDFIAEDTPIKEKIVVFPSWFSEVIRKYSDPSFSFQDKDEDKKKVTFVLPDGEEKKEG